MRRPVTLVYSSDGEKTTRRMKEAIINISIYGIEITDSKHVRESYAVDSSGKVWWLGGTGGPFVGILEGLKIGAMRL